MLHVRRARSLWHGRSMPWNLHYSPPFPSKTVQYTRRPALYLWPLMDSLKEGPGTGFWRGSQGKIDKVLCEICKEFIRCWWLCRHTWELRQSTPIDDYDHRVRIPQVCCKEIQEMRRFGALWCASRQAAIKTQGNRKSATKEHRKLCSFVRRPCHEKKHNIASLKLSRISINIFSFLKWLWLRRERFSRKPSTRLSLSGAIFLASLICTNYKEIRLSLSTGLSIPFLLNLWLS